MTDDRYVFLLLLNIILLLIGIVLDLFPANIIFGPVFVSIAADYDVDPVHFGIIFCVNLLLGLNTSPVGSGLVIGAAVGKVRLEELIREARPFIATELVEVLIITYVPFLTTIAQRFLTGLLGGA